MHRSGPDLVLAATDLAHYSACAHRTWLDRLRVLGEIERPFDAPAPWLELLRERGHEHELRYLDRLAKEGKRIRAFPELAREERNPDGYRRRHEETLAAMREGADVIHQGTLFDGRWLGFVDVLLRVDRPSALGSWSYEVVDAKLAREAKAGALLQTCVYSSMLTRVQATAPEHVHLYLGGPHPRLATFRLAHFAAYHRSLEQRFDAHLEAAPGADALPRAPEPAELCQVCEWRARCQGERVAADHLSLVAGIHRDQRRALVAAGVPTLEALALLPLDPPPDGLRAASFARIRDQARIQLEGRRRGAPVHEILPLEENPGGRPLGLAALPLPHPEDRFFDLEGADHAYEDGLEYLWGISDTRDGYRSTWAVSPDAEKEALAHFLAESEAWVEAHPGAHVYHFGHYETTALKRLVGRYGVGTDALDRLLQREVFVDLHRVVRQGVRASVESYSIKALEPHYGFTRSVPLEEANPVRHRLEHALALGAREPAALEGADVVEGYNRDDCVSTRALRDWLEGLRAELEAREGRPIPRPLPPEPRDAEDEGVLDETRALFEALLDGVSEERDERDGAVQVRWLAAHLLEWHRREDKSAWWDYFRLRELSVDELVEETKPLAGLRYTGIMGTEKSSLIHRFHFPPQEHRIEAGKRAKEPARVEGEKDKGREVWAIDDAEGWIELKVGRNAAFEPEQVRALFPDEIVPTPLQRARLRETARRLLEGEDALAAWSPASLALLRRDPPRFDVEDGASGGGAGAGPVRDTGGPSAGVPDGPVPAPRPHVPLPALAPYAPLIERATAAALRLQEGVLPVQGPPGTGKTYTGARMIRSLLRAGRRVGVTGPSHKVITNLLDAVCAADTEGDPPAPVHGLQVTKEEGCGDRRFTCVPSASDTGKAVRERDEAGEPPLNLIAGTAWLWSRDEMEGAVDVLFIDEAGQFSLANALAVAPAARRLVLLGDPQQLDQPQKGIHPPGAEVSVLEHLAGEDGIVGRDRGLFLGETWRMRPEITAFTSELFYGGELRARPELARQRIVLGDGSEIQGPVLQPVEHEGNSRESEEEACAVAALYTRLLARGATFTDRHGTTRPLGVDDLLVVAPYNAQVARIRAALARADFAGARVGTVDKFQGQEAPVAIYSLASSSAEDAPRGMEFLYALDRLNVATSRARVATVVVASPRVFTAECRRPEQMRMVNAVVRYGEMAAVDAE